MAGPLLRNLTLALTYRCNSRCRICDIWKVRGKDALSLRKIRDVLGSDAAKDVESVFLTGGEPFMRDDLAEIVDSVREHLPDSFVLISTNGMCRDEILRFLRECRHHVTLSFSVDGIRKHDEQRGVDGAFERTVGTIERVRREFPEQDMIIKFTITPLNYDEILDVYRLAGKHGARFHVKPVENLSSYTRPLKGFDTEFPEEKIAEIERQIGIIHQDLLSKNYIHDARFIKMIPAFLRDRRSVGLECRAPENSAFIMPDGHVHLCLYFEPVGDLKEQSMDEAWLSEKARIVRERVREGKCPVCMSYHGSFSSFENPVK